jgi:hypothetical protein
MFYPEYYVMYAYFIFEEIAFELFGLFKLFTHGIFVKTILCSFKIKRFRGLYENIGVVVKLMGFAHSRGSSWRGVAQKGRLLWGDEGVA